MRLILLTLLAITLTGCSTTYQGQTYGEIAAEGFLEGFLPDRAWYDNFGRVVGYGAGRAIR